MTDKQTQGCCAPSSCPHNIGAGQRDIPHPPVGLVALVALWNLQIPHLHRQQHSPLQWLQLMQAAACMHVNMHAMISHNAIMRLLAVPGMLRIALWALRLCHTRNEAGRRACRRDTQCMGMVNCRLTGPTPRRTPAPPRPSSSVARMRSVCSLPPATLRSFHTSLRTRSCQSHACAHRPRAQPPAHRKPICSSAACGTVALRWCLGALFPQRLVCTAAWGLAPRPRQVSDTYLTWAQVFS